MNYKNTALVKKIFQDFIHGVFGEPKIPTKSEVLSKINEYTSSDYSPILDNIKLVDLAPSGIVSKFTNIIDDIDVLFTSIELESSDILDQLTNSIKEYNGSKRELDRLQTFVNDVGMSKFGEEFFNSSFTESFNNLDNIDTFRSDSVDLNAGIFTIDSNGSNVLSLSHYSGKRLDFSVSEYYSPILENGFVGNTDAESIINSSDPRYLLYRVKTQRPTSLKVVTSLQLLPDGKPTNINKVIIDTESTVGKGHIRLYYRDIYNWKDVPNTSIQTIKSNSVVFNFSTISCTHIKIEFVKDTPDSIDTNEYFIPICNISIHLSSNKNSAILTSKSIDVSNITPVISSIQCDADVDIPQGSNIKVSVANDVKINGQFRNSLGEVVSPLSANIASFDSSADGHVYLSDMCRLAGSVSGLYTYTTADYDWKEIKTSTSYGDNIPDKLYFKNTKSHDIYDSSLYNFQYLYKYGDRNYSGGYLDWVVSGWCNETNPYWDYLEPLVNSGIYNSGITITTSMSGTSISWIEDQYGNINPEITNHTSYSGQWLGNGYGYPYNYSGGMLFGEYSGVYHGWWRPYSHTIIPTGIDPLYDIDNDGYLDLSFCDTAPDFSFNGSNYYKIYKFSPSSNLISSSIKLYSYQKNPISVNSSYFNHNFLWNYKSGWRNLTKKITISYNSDNTVWSGYKITIPIGMENSEFLKNPIKEIRKSGTNVVLQPTEYTVTYRKESIIIDFLRLLNRLESTSVSFDITFRYRCLDRYVSTWDGYIVVLPNTVNPNITFNNFRLKDSPSVNGIGKVKITNLVSGETTEYSEQEKYDIKLVSSIADTQYKIQIHCASDTTTGFTAKDQSDNHWVPSTSNITLTDGMYIVSKLDPIKIVDFSSLIYDKPSNSEKAAIITESDGSKFLVVKEPPKDLFPGYYFSEKDRTYKMYGYTNNNGHYIRYYYQSGVLQRYTTGSSGNMVLNMDGSTDYDWNNGVVANGYSNINSDIFFRHHSTIGYPLNLEKSSTIHMNDTLFSGDIDPCPSGQYWNAKVIGSSEWLNWVNTEDIKTSRLNQWNSTNNSIYIDEDIPNRGFLYYNTGENLPLYYSISYLEANGNADSNSRFLYKIELFGGESNNSVPKVKSIHFTINED